MDKIKYKKIFLQNFDKLKTNKQNISFSNTPTLKKQRTIKNAFSECNIIQQNLSTKKNINDNYSSTTKNFYKIKKLKFIKDNTNIYEDLGREKLQMKKIFKDLITWNDRKRSTIQYNNNYELDLKKFRIKTLKSNDIINNELIPFLKSSKIVENDPIDALKFIKLKFSVFDKDFSYEKFKEEEKKLKYYLKLKEAQKLNKIIDSPLDKRIQKTKIKNELRIRDSLIMIHKKLIMNKLKKKKFTELLDETYKLLEKARVEYLLSVDILRERINCIKKYYAAFINLFQGFPIKFIEERIKSNSIKKVGSSRKEKEGDSEENYEIIDEVEKFLNIKNEKNFSTKYSSVKFKLKYEEKIKMYREYNSIHEDILKEIQNYGEKFNNIQIELDVIISTIKKKIEEINEDSNQMISIQKKLSHNQISYYLKILKEGLDTRDEGLSWIIIRLIELNVHIDYSLFPDFLDLQQIKYLIQISKYEYEINQLKIILEFLREKETGTKNANLKIFSSINEEGLLSSNYFNKGENIKFDYNKTNNNLKSEKLLLKLKLMKSNSLLLNNNSNFFDTENKKLEFENKLVDLNTKQLKRKLSLCVIDKKSNITNKKENNNNLNKLQMISTDKKSKYFYDILKILEKINNINNLLNEKREKEIINFSEKFKLKNLSDEITKAYNNRVFNALFGNATFYSFKNYNF